MFCNISGVASISQRISSGDISLMILCNCSLTIPASRFNPLWSQGLEDDIIILNGRGDNPADFPVSERMDMRFRSLVVMLTMLLIAGCGKLTMENYNKLKMGMSYDEVVKIIGSPDKCSEAMGMRNCQWSDEKKSINVTFAGDKALVFTCDGIR